MQYSYSRVSTFKQCRRRFKFQYIEGLRTVPDQAPDNALILGNALHHGIEKGREAMLEHYFGQYYVITDEQINEAIKLEILLPKVRELLKGVNIRQHEYLIDVPEFKGIVDLITNNDDGTVDVFDFKYSNNVDRYLESGQLHIYKKYLENAGFKVKRLGFIFIPKVTTAGRYATLKQRAGESLYSFRRRIEEAVSKSQIQLIPVDYDESQFTGFIEDTRNIEAALQYPKNVSKLCDWCNFNQSCLQGVDYMILPKNERRAVTVNTTPDMWLYGDSYSGKTVFMDTFDDVLMINTDGNIDHISSPVVRIADTVKVEGRLTTRIFAWKNFLDVIAELEKKQNDFKTVVVDLAEDMFEHCRLYMYDKLQIDHEHDAGFGKGYDMVRTEFLSNMKRLKNCGYQLVYISKVAMAEITLKGGSKVTTFKPNINDKIANVLAGTVDLTARVVADGDERYLNFKVSPYIFGGSRYNFGVDQIPLNRNEFIKTLTAAQKSAPQKADRTLEKPAEEASPAEAAAATSEQSETPRRGRQRKSEPIGDTPDDGSGTYTEPEETVNDTPTETEQPSEAAEETTTRRRRRA